MASRYGAPKVMTNEPVTIIEPQGATRRFPWRELWENRRLVAMMIFKTVRARYKDTWLGIFWALVQPLAYMLVLNLFFGIFGRMSSGPIPYLLFLFTALLPFQFFTKAANEGARSIQNNSELIRKIYLPRLIFPFAVVGTALVDFLVALGLLAVMLVFYRVSPTINLLAFPVLLFILLLAGGGIAVLLSILSVYFRDLRLAVPMIMQIWFFATPIIYQASIVPESVRTFYGLNPMVGLVEAFRWCLLGLPTLPDPRMLVVSLLTVIALFFGSIMYFQRVEARVSDVV